MFKKYFWAISIVSFSLGILFSYYLELANFFPIYFYFILAVVFLLFCYFKKKICFLILLFFFLGVWRCQIFLSLGSAGNIANYLNKDFLVIGTIISNPELSNNKQKFKVKIISGRDEEGVEFKLRGKILVYALSSPEYNYGDTLEIKGKCVEGGLIEDFDYSLYLKRFGISAVSYYPSIKRIDKISTWGLSRFKFLVYEFGNTLSREIDANLSYSSSAIVQAMFLGNKSLMDAKMKENFSHSGLSHIIAISGLHISLLSSILLQVLLNLGLSRKKSFYFCICFLIFYLVLIGAPASAIRASLMGFWALLAVYVGRLGNLSNALFLSGILMLFFNPLLLIVDIGFQLSFLAVTAIIFVYPVLKEFFQKKFLSNIILRKFFKTKIGQWVIDIISITLSVQILSAPILISSFKQISLIAPLSNLLVLAFLPLVISLILLALITSLFFPLLASIFYLVLDLIVSYIFWVGEFSSGIPYAYINIYSWSIYLTLVYYALLIYLLLKNRGLI